MHLASPIWLTLLIPWAVLTAWLLWGLRDRTNVPFLQLWQGPVRDPSTRRQWTLPLHLLAGIVATLLGAIALAGPVVRQTVVRPLTPTTGSVESRANLSIVRAAVADRPHGQVMVTLRNDSELSSAVLTVQGEQREVLLPGPGTERNYFFDLPRAPDRLDVLLQAEDVISGADRVTLTRRRRFARPELRSDLPPEVRRVVEAYGRARPSTDGSPVVAISDDLTTEPGVIVAPESKVLTVTGPLVVAAHPVTESIDFGTTGLQALDAVPPGEGWTNVVTVAGRPNLAVRETPARQAWVGLHASDFSRTPAYVMLWTNLIEWTAGQADEPYVATLHPTTIARSSFPTSQPIETGRSLASVLFLGSVLWLFLAASLWPSGRRLTGFSAPRTV